MSWLFWSNPDPPPPPPKSRLLHFRDQLASGPIPSELILLTVGGLASVGSVLVYKRYFRRIKTSDWVSPHDISRKRWIKGTVTSVGDADGFRLYHTPAFGWRWPLKFRGIPNSTKGLLNQTISVRVAAVDAPELGHFGKEPQFFAEESMSWLKSQIEGQRVYCQLLKKDQYGRIVCHVTKAPKYYLPGSLFSGNTLAIDMLRAGCATVYKQAGAEYGPLSKDEYIRVEAKARSAKRGMWKSGEQTETPAQYKRRHAQAVKPAIVSKTAVKSLGSVKPAIGSKTIARSSSSGWISRLFARQ